MTPEPRASVRPQKRRCTAHNRQGNPCGQSPVPGATVCKFHGGAAPQTLKKARERLEAAADRMAARLLGIAESENVPAYVALQAVNSVLDRVGITEPNEVTVTVKPFDQLLGDVTGGSRADYRRSIGHPDPEPHSLAIEQADPHRPGGLPFVIDGELADDVASPHVGEHQAVRDAGELDSRGPSEHRPDYYEPARQTLANPVPLPSLPNGGYLPTEDALEVAQNANRNHRAQLRRR
ncbi:HGGxSTG domain-containing protein [Mycolicibacterium fortuitum]|nr:HGGxSTG domain-containing protein [Mycolicibacterium fortuitum]